MLFGYEQDLITVDKVLMIAHMDIDRIAWCTYSFTCLLWFHFQQGFTAALYAFYRDADGNPLTQRSTLTGKPTSFDGK